MAINVCLPLNDTNPSEIASLSLTEWYVGQGSYKCYEDYKCITDTSSPQWRLQQEAYTDENGLRKVDDLYCVALGSHYGTKIGTEYIIELDTGAQFKVILADQKADCDTDVENIADGNGAVIEFVVDTPYLDSTARKMGDISYINGFGGKVRKIYEQRTSGRYSVSP